MKLQKQLSRKVKGIEYPKFVVTIPPKQIGELGWKEGIELVPLVENNKLTIIPKN
ncbi:hypothetical protein BMS3Abin16_00793 [archaeon BMS3Abin16]|nr:hypothetical protein BMS3Abin16_00793 [archaeon BMS3Abin16]